MKKIIVLGVIASMLISSTAGATSYKLNGLADLTLSGVIKDSGNDKTANALGIWQDSDKKIFTGMSVEVDGYSQYLEREWSNQDGSGLELPVGEWGYKPTSGETFHCLGTTGLEDVKYDLSAETWTDDYGEEHTTTTEEKIQNLNNDIASAGCVMKLTDSLEPKILYSNLSSHLSGHFTVIVEKYEGGKLVDTSAATYGSDLWDLKKVETPAEKMMGLIRSGADISLSGLVGTSNNTNAWEAPSARIKIYNANRIYLSQGDGNAQETEAYVFYWDGKWKIGTYLNSAVASNEDFVFKGWYTKSGILVTAGSEIGSTEDTIYARYGEPDPVPTTPPAIVASAGGIRKGAKITAGNVKYQVTKFGSKAGTVKIISAAKNVKKVVVPASLKYKGYVLKVTAIGNGAFKNCKKLSKVTIGMEVKEIGKQAFQGCKKLKRVEIKSKKITRVGKKAFNKVPTKCVYAVPTAKSTKYKKMIRKAK